MEDKQKGAWILHHADKLRGVDTSEYDSIATAGRAGTLLSALAQDEQASLTRSAVEALAKANGISVHRELNPLLSALERAHLVTVGDAGIEVLGVSTTDVVVHTARMLDALGPPAHEQAALWLAEKASEEPLILDRVVAEMSDAFEIPKADACQFVSVYDQIGFVDSERVDEATQLVFNGNLFRRDEALKVRRALDSMSGQESVDVREGLEMVRCSGCVEISSLHRIMGESMFSKLHGIGMVDVSTVQNEKESVHYVTLPQAFSKFGNPFVDDALDLAKALAGCLTYGVQRSSRTRGSIRMLGALLAKLIRGEEVGPADAIGQDYRVLEHKGVVRVRSQQGRFFMKLLKREVGILAKEVLLTGDASVESITSLPGASVAAFVRPEANRASTRKRQVQSTPGASRDVLVALRGGVR